MREEAKHATKRPLLRFGVFEVDLDRGELRKLGSRIQLQPKPLQMLEMLLECPGEIVSREELRRRLWGDDTFVDFESGLNTAANRLRLKLGDAAENPRFIETVARTGYRFIAPVETIDREDRPRVATVVELPPTPQAPGRWFTRYRTSLIAAGVGVAAAVLTAFLVLHFGSSSRDADFRFRQVTFRRGQVLGARFSPDGRNILYTAQWDRDARRLYQTAIGSPESRVIGFPDMTLASVSATGELALLSATGTTNIGGSKLSRVPLNGAAPLHLDEAIMSAEWAHDPDKIAVVRAVNGRNQLEYPRGKILYSTSGWISGIRFSPVSSAIAFIEHPIRHDDAGTVRIVSPEGSVVALGSLWHSLSGLAWAPSGKEIWFTASRDEQPRSLWAITLKGELRSVLHGPGVLTLRDISRDGRMLMSRETRRLEMAGSLDGKEPERNYSWLDWSRIQEISSDGRLILFDESGEASGPHSLVYVRNTDNDQVKRIGDGLAMAFSPGAGAVLLSDEDHRHLRLAPVDGGRVEELPVTGLFYQWARFLPDGKHLLVLASRPGQGLRLYLQQLKNTTFNAVGPEMMVRNAVVSPDGDSVAVLSADGHLRVWPIPGGQPKTVASDEPLAPLRWSRDGRYLFVQRLKSYTDIPARVLRLRLDDGQVTPWKTIAPADPMGVNSITGVVITADELGYIYSYRRVSSELFLCEPTTPDLTDR